jgi:hypothetical protein
MGVMYGGCQLFASSPSGQLASIWAGLGVFMAGRAYGIYRMYSRREGPFKDIPLLPAREA